MPTDQGVLPEAWRRSGIHLPTNGCGQVDSAASAAHWDGHGLTAMSVAMRASCGVHLPITALLLQALLPLCVEGATLPGTEDARPSKVFACVVDAGSSHTGVSFFEIGPKADEYQLLHHMTVEGGVGQVRTSRNNGAPPLPFYMLTLEAVRSPCVGCRPQQNTGHTISARMSLTCWTK